MDPICIISLRWKSVMYRLGIKAKRISFSTSSDKKDLQFNRSRDTIKGKVHSKYEYQFAKEIHVDHVVKQRNAMREELSRKV